jgi:hypothetical protein
MPVGHGRRCFRSQSNDLHICTHYLPESEHPVHPVLSHMNEGRPEHKEVLNLLESGATVSEVADRLGCPRHRVERIKTEAKARQCAEVARQEIRAADDIDRRWPVETLLDALDLPKRSRTCLRTHFADRGMGEATLRDAMDFLFLELPVRPEDWKSHFQVYQHRHLGQLTYTSLVRTLTKTDLGPAYRTEWDRRRDLALQLLTKNFPCNCLACIFRYG